MKSKRRPVPSAAPLNAPVYNVTSIFSAHRDLRPCAKLSMGNSPLSVEEADILILLYGLRYLGWDDCPVGGEGFVAFRDLKSVLVHDPSLFTRRLKKLADKEHGYIEVDRIPKGAARRLHGNAQMARITDVGVAAVKPIWATFERFSAKLFSGELLKEFSQKDLETHAKINEAISQTLRQWRDPVSRLL